VITAKGKDKMTAYPDFELGQVQSVIGGHGFNITNPQGRPLFTFVYATRADAEAGRDAVDGALANAVEVVTVPGS
jgi:hypothetical protein